MSSLIFFTDSQQALVVTDTLATTLEGEPYFYSTKAHYLPHLRMIIAGTGYGGFADDWYQHANRLLHARDVEEVDRYAPELLRRLWTDSDEDLREQGKTTTVYQFGIIGGGKVAAFAYRSTNDFTSERLPEGTAIKPEATVPEEGSLLESIPLIMMDQRRRQAEKPKGERLGIGGEAIAMHLTAERFQCWPVFRFDDFEEQDARALERNSRRSP